jgi:hypothetical protein
VFYQNTLGPMTADDGSDELYTANLAGAFSDVEQTTVWLGCPDCTDSKEPLDAYLTIIRPRSIIPHHWDGPMPGVEDGVDYPFVAADYYSEAVTASGADLLVPKQYFERYLIKEGVLSRGGESPIQVLFALEADPF